MDISASQELKAATFWKNHEYETSRFFGWVNQVVAMHQGPSIDKFRVYSSFVSGYGTQLHKWVRFAFSKQVKELVLNLKGLQTKRIQSPECPEEVPPLGFNMLRHPSCLGGISSLSSLHLHYANVSQENIEFLLSHCPHLERVYLHSAPLLSNLKVKTSKLKYLTIITSHCDFNLLEIDAENLLYFEYQDEGSEGGPMVLKNLPMLVETTFHGGLCIDPFPIFHTLYPFCKQLRKLSLGIWYNHWWDDLFIIPDGVVPIFTQLRHFTCTVDCYGRTCILQMKRFIEACPMLEEFKLQVAFMEASSALEEAKELRGIVLEDEPENGEATKSELCEFRQATLAKMTEEKQTHPNLKILEIVGFLGARCDVELALAIVSYASSLETIICDPAAVRYSDSAYRFINDTWEECIVANSKRRARKLSKLVAPKVKVVII